MAYIAPNTTITFFKDTGLSPSYENTLYFSNESEKNLYFANWSSTGGRQIGIVSQSYQRENRNYCRVGIPIASLYDCDYMRFVNSSFENKVFYAFVTSINYINNNTTEVEYQLDPLMTWMGTFTLKQCYIERQHVVNDAIGANIAEEGISTGPYVYEGVHTTDQFGNTNCMIRVLLMNKDEAQARMVQGVYSPAIYRDFDPDVSGETGLDGCAEFLNGLVTADLADNVVSIFMYPKPIRTGAQAGSPTVLSYSWDKPYNNLDGYVPKNNKLFVYPYKYLEVDNSEGATEDYKYEFFNTLPDTTSSGQYHFRVVGTVYASVELSLDPVEYNGRGGGDPTVSLGMSHFPQCAWGIDTYQAYLAQKNAYYNQNVVQQTASNILGFIPDVASGTFNSGLSGFQKGGMLGEERASYYGAIGAGVNSIISGLSKTVGIVAGNMIDNIVRPELGTQARGSFNADLKYSAAEKWFTFKQMCITKNYAKMIDDYFTMFGYKVGQVATPNMNARPHWTYVKTVGCDCGGKVPASDKKAIEAIFDNGTRFWHNLDEMGNYSLDNSPA